MIIDCHGHYTTEPKPLMEFRQKQIAAIKDKREPNGSLAQVLPCMRVLGKLEQIIDPQRKAHA